MSSHYKQFSEAFEEYFSSLKSGLPDSPHNLYEPLRYFLGLEGKRVRPLLVLVAADCFGGIVKQGMPAAAAVELFHNFSLIHDDIMDRAPLRRGKVTVHEKWNNNIAILSGDALMVKAFQELAKTERVGPLLELFSQTALGVCEGQQLDMDFESRDDVRVEEYLAMIRLKTAVLLAASMKMGALCGAASAQQAEGFYDAGISLGLAFQLTDDHLDVFGDVGKTGKQSGGDIISNKKTWLLIRAYELSNAAQRAELKRWTSTTDFDPSEKVNAVKNVFEGLRLSSLLEKEIAAHYDKAFSEIRAACPDHAKAEAFISFITSLVNREK